MIKPYQNDIDMLKEELEHYTFIAQKTSQEHDVTMTKYFGSLCRDVRSAIQTINRRQENALSEWRAISSEKRQELLSQLYSTVESTTDCIKENGCPEFALYLEHYLISFLMDLVDLDD